MGVLEQESYLSYIKKGDKKITSEKQSAAIKNKTILQALSIICDVVGMSNKLNKSLCNILKVFGRVDWDFISSDLQTLDMELNSFT